MNRAPLRLAAPEPGWSTDVDVVVIGSGIAGLTAARRAADRGSVLVVTKDVLAAGSTRWAQGGIAAALDPEDSPAEHLRDTLDAGAGLSEPDAVRVLTAEGPAALRRLIATGAVFDTDPGGRLALGREGGHRRDRIAHAGGDATGAEVSRALVAAVRADPRIEVIEHALALDLLLAADGGVAGATLHVMGEGRRDGVGAVHARAVILATGGLGQVYASTTNPAVSTGDGIALALRAGAVVRDLEFVQFHPTVLWLGAQSSGQQPLISEAVRGEGAVLVDHDGEPIMAGVHELGDLAPRDVVAKALLRRMRSTGAPHVYLDATGFGEERWRVRFPTILASCREHGIDPVTDPIPVLPACHYAAGGVRTDLHGRTTVAGLYACGEVACSGVHGANRLASNSLLEGLVFAERIVGDLAGGLPPRRVPAPERRASGLLEAGVRAELQEVMSSGAGVLRCRQGLAHAERRLGELARSATDPAPCTETWEATNLLTVAQTLLAAATAREETRGSHWREDHPDRDDTWWLGHLDLTLGPEGPQVTYLRRDAGPAAADLDATDRDAADLDAADRDAGPAATDLDAELAAAGLVPADVRALARAALAEDLEPGGHPRPGHGPRAVGDLTTVATVVPGQLSVADLVARADGVVAGLPVARAVLAQASNGTATVLARVRDGDRVNAGDVLASVTGRTRDLLSAERTVLNLLCHLCGIATVTRAWVDACAGTAARVRDTRKTTPGLRALEKYAVRCGGGLNHRMSLTDAALIKDNHVVAAGGLTAAFAAVRARCPDVEVQVEVDDLGQLREALTAGAELVLLDNMTVDQLREAVARNAGAARLEASGGLSLDNAAEVASTGVDYLAVGALTHSAPALDIGMDLRAAPGHATPAQGAAPGSGTVAGATRVAPGCC